MQIKDIIEKKRDGRKNSVDELAYLIEGAVSGKVRDYQVSAWLMAAYLNGLSRSETVALTRLMWKSGQTFPRQDRSDYWIDKHSTGGVGDKTSLLLTPIVTAVCQQLLGPGKVRIPMVSGRGLGHTGGTLDKLESVSGFQTTVAVERALEILHKNDFFMIGQSDDIAPADKILYALRDATCTVESIGLIVGSIMSKKLSENLDGIVFDMKCGQGAFMQSPDNAHVLGETLVEVAKASALEAVCVVTDMNQPLGTKVGHHLEVEECFEFLMGEHQEERLAKVTYSLASWMVHLATRKSVSVPEAESLCQEVVVSGRAAELYQTMFSAQGGQWEDFLVASKRLREELNVYELKALEPGYVKQIRARDVGWLVHALGGGRERKSQSIDAMVGVEVFKRVGQTVGAGETVLKVFHRGNENRELIESYRDRILEFSTQPLSEGEVIMELIQ